MQKLNWKRLAFWYVKELISPAAFESLARGVGTILSDYAVRIVPNSRSYVCSPNEITFHNNEVSCRYIGWHCLEQDADDGRTLLLDSRCILQSLSAEEVNSLSSVLIETAPHLVQRGAPSHSQLLERTASGTRICYVPWLKFDAPNPTSRGAFERFQKAISEKSHQKEYTAIRMRPLQAIFIDNLRVLHGREALSSNSRRHLRRLWIAAS